MTKKNKIGEVDYLANDDCSFLVMRGDFTAEQIVNAAVEQSVICESDKEDWLSCTYYQTHYKIVPRDGYSSWYSPRNEPCRGSFFASVLQWD